MKIKPFKTSDVNSLHLNILLYGHGGAGKTTAIGRFADTFGKGLIISGEGGLSSISAGCIKLLSSRTVVADSLISIKYCGERSPVSIIDLYLYTSFK